jgi:hypothetical protein
MAFFPQGSNIGAESRVLADADYEERERSTGEDHAAHAPGRICKACGRMIEPGQDARRRGDADWAHDTCPPPPAAEKTATEKPTTEKPAAG